MTPHEGPLGHTYTYEYSTGKLQYIDGVPVELLGPDALNDPLARFFGGWWRGVEEELAEVFGQDASAPLPAQHGSERPRGSGRNRRTMASPQRSRNARQTGSGS